MRKFKTALALLLTLALAVQLSTAALADDDNIQSGSCRTNLTWTLNTDTGVLTISGSGAMTNYAFVPHTSVSNTPWDSSIITRVIETDISSIGNFAFAWCDSLTSVTIPNSVTTIGDSAFDGCTSLTDVYYAGSEDEWNAIDIDDYNDPLLSANIHYGYFGWNFRNNYDGFGYDSDYAIPEKRYADVFGKAYVALAKRADEATYASMIDSEWNGSCFGMSLTSVLFELGLLDWDSYGSLYTGGDLYEDGFFNVNDYYTEVTWKRDSFFSSKYIYTVSEESSEITKLIEAYHIMQGRTSTDYLSTNGSTWNSVTPNYYTKDEEKSNDTKTYWVHNADGNYISSMLEKIQTSAEPLVICMAGENFGHAVVARTDKAPVETEDGWWRVYI